MGIFSRDVHEEAGKPKASAFPHKEMWQRRQSFSLSCGASSHHSRGQRLFLQDAPEKGQDLAHAGLLKAAAPGPCGTQVALEGTELVALDTQSSCHPMPPTYTQHSIIRS